MKKSFTLIFTTLFTPFIAAAAATIPPKVVTLVGNVYQVILNPIIALLFAAAFTYFVYGVVNFVWNGENPVVREKGKSSIIWGIAGMAIMFGVFGILGILVGTIGGDVNTALKDV